MASLADAFASIESSGNPYAWNRLPGGRRSRYRGLFQFGPEQERRYGITDWTDPVQQRSAFERHIGDLRTDLSRRLGRAPADWELYFGHQQGPSGSAALLNATPGTSAWEAIRPFYGSDAMAHQAITGNIPRGHALYGRDSDEIGADEFARMWQARYGRAPGAPAPLGAPVAPPVQTAEPASSSWFPGGLSALLGIGSAEAQTPPAVTTAPPVATPFTPMPAPGAPPFTPRPDPRGLGVLGLPRMTPMPPAATVPPFGAPTVTPVPSSEQDTLGYGPSEIQPMGREITREMVEAGLPPTPPPAPDADAIVRGAEAAAADRAAQPAQPGYFERLMSNPAFLAGLSILGTAPGGNWGPNAAQAASQAIRGGREAEEWRRLQARRATQDRIWREAFGPNGQPNAGHPLLTGMPPEMAATIYAMGAEEGLPAAQRWQMFRGQRQEQMREREANLAMFGMGPPQAPPMPSDGALAGAVSDRLNAAAGLPGAPQDTSGIGGPPLPGTRPPITPPAGSGAGIAPPMAALSAPPSAPAPTGRAEPTVTIGNRTMPVSMARALATTLPDGARHVVEQAIAAAEREAQPPEAIRTKALQVDQAYRSLTTSLEGYARLVERTGSNVFPGQEADDLRQARANILLQLKELHNLGVLNGPDLPLMESMLYDPSVNVFPGTGGGPLGMIPSGVTGLIGEATGGHVGFATPGQRARRSVDSLMEMLRVVRNSAAGAAGMPPVGPSGRGSGQSQPGNDPLGIR